MINSVRLNERRLDTWVWVRGDEGVYSVNSTDSFLQVETPSSTNIDFKSIWSGCAPSKVKAFIWRLFLNRV